MKFNIYNQEASDTDGGGTKETPTQQDTPTTNEAAGDTTDEFGYAKVAPDKPAEEGTKPAPKTEETPEIKDPGTGYGVDAPEVPVEEPETPVDVKLDFEVDVKDLDAKEALKLKNFAKDHKLSKEAAQALIDLKKTETLQFSQSQEQSNKVNAKAVSDLKAGWDKELRTDPKFGGDKFIHSIAKVEKVLSEFMPGTKKELTERKSMLPPYVMRDLAKLADHLYSSENMVQGDARSKVIEDKEDDHLSFYK